MKWRIPDTIFTRLFGLVICAVGISHVIGTLLLFIFMDNSPPMDGPPDGLGPGPEHMMHHHHPPHVFNLPFLSAQSVLLIMVGLAAWFGAKLLAKPIQELAGAATRLGNNLNAPAMEENGPEEARAAARIFNHMQDKVRQQVEERAQFLAAVSHDLRTPLTRIKLRVEQVDNEQLKQQLGQDIVAMSSMLDATLHYLRNDSMPDHWDNLDIQALVESIVEDAQEQGHDVTLTGSAMPLLTQPSSLRRCFENLLDNALRYGQNAQISVRDSGHKVIIEIKDSGPGIPENQIKRVFEPFVRLENSRNRHTGGVGLGLAIARDAAKRVDGELTLQNAPEGGLVARLVLPRRS